MFKIVKSIFVISFVFLLSSCDYYNEMSNLEYISDIEHLENIVEFTNNLGEQYRVEYEERNGFPSQQMKINIFKSEEHIISYWSKFGENYIPQKMLYLFTNKESDYYFVANEFNYFIFIFGSEILESHGNQIQINVNYSDIKSIDDYIVLSKIMQKNIDRQELIDKFQACEYDDKYILELYDLNK